MAFDELRQDYDGAPLDKAGCAADPMEQFQHWFQQAMRADIEMANAMTLSTVDTMGAPHARIVLLKDADADGFVFFTNYQSRKGKEMAHSSKASLLFWWHPMSRQIRIDGSVEKVTAQESDDYFKTRPRGSNLAAMSSLQSEAVESRAVLDQRISELTAQTGNAELQRPENWGGYRLKPHCLEFWQGRPDRSHDRIEYCQVGDDKWSLTRLCP